MIKIILVEDDLDDVEILEYGLKDAHIDYNMEVINDGSSALEFIRDGKKMPDIFILDLNLPKVHGRDVILALKGSHSFSKVPLLILTTSSSQEDTDYAYKHGADDYVIKPTNQQQIAELCDTIVKLANLKKG